MTAGSRAAFAVAFAVAGAATAQESREWDCVVQPREVIHVGSAAEGILRERLVERGDRVTKGQELARLDDTLERLAVEFAALEAERDIELRSREVTAEYRSREAERLGQLAERSLMPEAEKQRAEMEQDLAELGVRAAQIDQSLADVRLRQARAVLDRRTIRSPATGVVTEIAAAAGEFVTEQTEILTIAVLDVLHVEVFLPIETYSDVAIGDSVVVRLPEPVGEELTATIATIDSLFDAASDTFGVLLTLPNPDYAVPAGLRCRAGFGAD